MRRKANRKIILLVVLALLMTGTVLFVVFLQNPTNKTQTDKSQNQTTQPVTPPAAMADTGTQKQALVIGSQTAPVTIVKYGDFQCPFCSQFFRQTEPQIIKEYVDTGKVKIEYRVETHIGEESILAGEAAYCANDQQAFKAYHDELYKRQKGINSGTFSNAKLKQIASDLALDRAKFDTCLDSKAYRAVVEESNKEAIASGVTTTPTFFIGEHKITGAQPFTILKTVIDGQL